MDHRVFGGVNLGINPIGLIFRVNLLVIFWGDREVWRLILLKCVSYFKFHYSLIGSLTTDLSALGMEVGLPTEGRQARYRHAQTRIS